MSTSDPEEIRADIERTRGELSRDVDALGDKVNPSNAARRQVDRVKSGVTRAKDRVMGTAHDTMDSARDTSHGVADRGREAASSVADSARHTASSVADTVGSAPRAVREQTQGNPLAVGLVAFGLGLVAASLIPASRTEQRAAVGVKEKAAPLVHVTPLAAIKSTSLCCLSAVARDMTGVTPTVASVRSTSCISAARRRPCSATRPTR